MSMSDAEYEALRKQRAQEIIELFRPRREKIEEDYQAALSEYSIDIMNACVESDRMLKETMGRGAEQQVIA